MKKRELLERIEWLERRVAELECARPISLPGSSCCTCGSSSGWCPVHNPPQWWQRPTVTWASMPGSSDWVVMSAAQVAENSTPTRGH
jgi:hypothetical protein